MAQFGRPSVDTYIGGYKDQADGVTNIWNSIDEVSYSDTDYIKSALAPASAPYVCKLTSVEDPLSASGHTVRYRYCKDAAGGAQINLTIELRQGYVDEGTQGTLIATCATLTDISESWTSGSYNLTTGEANSITDYSSLFLRFVANQV